MPVFFEQIYKSRCTSISTFIFSGGSGSTSIPIGVLRPYYKRAILELIPVANLIYSGNINEFYLENGIVNIRTTNDFSVKAGLILNVNVLSFGELKEMSLGFGLGYKFTSNANDFENIYFSSLLSYKNFFRIGVGFGFSSVPANILKNGVKVGDALPSSIENLNDLLLYQNKPSVFLTLAFTGLNLTKKK